MAEQHEAVSTIEQAIEMGSEERYERQGWKVTRTGSGVRFVRDGYVRIHAQWIGHDWWIVAWEFSMGTGESSSDWRVERYPTDEVVLQLDMTMNAMWR